jgi:hypothetical protein
VRQLLAVLGEVEDDRIPPLAREVLQTLVAHLRDLETKIAGLDGAWARWPARTPSAAR